MNDGWLFLLLLALLYLSDCAQVVRRSGVAFVSFFGRSRHPRLPSELLGTPRGGLVMLNPLPPLGTVFRVEWPAFSVSPRGVLCGSPERLAGSGHGGGADAFVLLAPGVQAAGEQRDVCVGRRSVARFRTAGAARRAAEWLQACVGAPEERRGEIIRSALAESFDVAAIRGIAAQCRAATRLLVWLGNGMWGLLFVVAPLAVVRYGILLTFIPLALTVVALHVGILWTCWRTHRRVLPAERDARLEHVLKMLFCPPLAIRAVDAVSADLLDGRHPVAVALAIATPREAKDLALKWRRDLEYPLSPAPESPECAQADSWFRSRLAGAAAAAAASAKVNMEEALQAPAAGGKDERSYCPRCHMTYRVAAGTCPDCLGLALKPLPGKA